MLILLAFRVEYPDIICILPPQLLLARLRDGDMLAVGFHRPDDELLPLKRDQAPRSSLGADAQFIAKRLR